MRILLGIATTCHQTLIYIYFRLKYYLVMRIHTIFGKIVACVARANLLKSNFDINLQFKAKRSTGQYLLT